MKVYVLWGAVKVKGCDGVEYNRHYIIDIFSSEKVAIKRRGEEEDATAIEEFEVIEE